MQGLGEERLREEPTLLVVHRVHARRVPRRGIGLRDEGAHVRAVAIMMRAEGARAMRLKRQRMAGIGRLDAIPREIIQKIDHACSERRRVRVAKGGVGAIRRDEQIAILVRVGRHAMIEMDINARRGGEIPEDRQHRHTTKAGEPGAVDHDGLAAVDDVLVRPCFANGRDAAGDVGVALRQEAQRAPRQNDTEAKGDVRRVLLEYPHDMIGIGALDQRGEKQAGGPGAQNIDLHGATLHECQKFDNSF